MTIKHALPILPYSMNALAPYISEETLQYHYGKHHQGYVNNLNSLIQDTEFANLSLDEIILATHKQKGGIFNNAAQIWNHTFYWQCLTPNSTRAPQGKLADAINQKFESFDTFKKEFSQAAITTFGSGWAWLIKTVNDELEIVSTSNADTPLAHDQTALLTCDVWEHAYYIDYRNARATYVEKFWEIVNWDFVSSQFAR